MPTSLAAQVLLIRQFDLQPHPEGGFFRETYRCAQTIMRPALHGESSAVERSACTAIYYLLCDDAYSVWHRIRSDEIWHFYAGGALDVHVLHADGRLESHRLGNALEHPGAVFQAVVPADCWFAAERIDPKSYALAGCTVAPGFEFSEFELADAAALLALYPDHGDVIRRLSPVNSHSRGEPDGSSPYA
jgi:predicted cupin superfamily sugar epimerase